MLSPERRRIILEKYASMRDVAAVIGDMAVLGVSKPITLAAKGVSALIPKSKKGFKPTGYKARLLKKWEERDRLREAARAPKSQPMSVSKRLAV